MWPTSLPRQPVTDSKPFEFPFSATRTLVISPHVHFGTLTGMNGPIFDAPTLLKLHGDQCLHVICDYPAGNFTGLTKSAIVTSAQYPTERAFKLHEGLITIARCQHSGWAYSSGTTGVIRLRSRGKPNEAVCGQMSKLKAIDTTIFSYLASTYGRPVRGQLLRV